jgi:hypothetical protein
MFFLRQQVLLVIFLCLEPHGALGLTTGADGSIGYSNNSACRRNGDNQVKHVYGYPATIGQILAVTCFGRRSASGVQIRAIAL